MAPAHPPVSLADAEIARQIADAARTGRPIDRAPTLTQLLAAFGEDTPTPQARARVAAALAVSGVTVSVPLADASPEARIGLAPPPAPRRAGRALLGLLLLLVLLGGATAAALLLKTDDDKAGDALPPVPTLSTPVATTPTVTTPDTTTVTTPVATVTTPTTVATTTVGTVSTTPTTTTTKKRTSSAAARKARRERERRAARRKRERERRAAARRTVRATLSPSVPTYLCIKDGSGRQIFGGTLSGPRTFTGKVLRLNVGMGDSTTLTVNGKRLPLNGSPAGYELRPGGRATVLGSGQRPEC